MTLYFYTENYPYGLGEAWKTEELEILKLHFDQVVVVPFHRNKNQSWTAKKITDVEYLEPLFEWFDDSTWRDVLQLMRNYPKKMLNELLYATRFGISGVSAFKKSATKINRLLSHKGLRDLFKKKKAIHYFFWGRNTVETMALHSVPIYVVRLHGYDLYRERYLTGYLPFHRQILQKAKRILAISEQGMSYLNKTWKVDTEKIWLSRLGTNHDATAKMSKDKILRIYSCSSMVPVKRLDRLINALNLVEGTEVEWNHIGDGPLSREVKTQADKLNQNINVKFWGRMSPSEVVNHYDGREIDLFVNSSDSEGVPVSIMEAMAAEIPVIAPNVGGISEIVNDRNGFCISKANYEKEFLRAIHLYLRLTEDEKIQMRSHAKRTYLKKYHAPTNAKVLVSKLLTLS